MLNLVYNGHISIGRLSTRILGRDKAIVSSQLRSARRISSSPGFNARTHLSLRIAFGYDPHVRHCFRLVSSERLQCFSQRERERLQCFSQPASLITYQLPQENSLFQTGRRTTSDARTNSASWQSAFSKRFSLSLSQCDLSVPCLRLSSGKLCQQSRGKQRTQQASAAASAAANMPKLQDWLAKAELGKTVYLLASSGFDTYIVNC